MPFGNCEAQAIIALYFARFFFITMGMKKTSGRSHRRNCQKKPLVRAPIAFNQPPEDHRGFMSLLLQRISWKEIDQLARRKTDRGRPAHQLSASQLLVATIFHFSINCAGTLAEHLLMLTGIKMSESNLSERRQATAFEVFEELLRRVLRPLALKPSTAFYKAWRLVAIDGVEYSVCNRQEVNQPLGKGTKKSQSAFAKLRCAVLVELLMHNPLAAVLGRQGQSEWNLAQGLCQHLPSQCLLLADRLYGCGAFICSVWKQLQPTQGHFLIRIKTGLRIVRAMERLEDGSALVEIKALVAGDTHRIAQKMVVREIHATLKRQGRPAVQVRFWTSLLDPQMAPADQLVALYACRWEHELYFRELKAGLGINDLLRSQTVETAAQEVAAMIIGSSLIAAQRAELKPDEEPNHRISLIKIRDLLEPLWLTLLLGADLLSEMQKQQLADRFRALMSQMKMGKKRARSCPRVIRQPVQRWPKKNHQKTLNSPLKIFIDTAGV
jgi:hypothetical protein